MVAEIVSQNFVIMKQRLSEHEAALSGEHINLDGDATSAIWSAGESSEVGPDGKPVVQPGQAS